MPVIAFSFASLLDLWPILLAYAVGATPFGFLAAKAKGIDIRQHGSGNIGATNVLRVLGKPLGYSVLAADVCKGLLPVLLAKAVSDSSFVVIGTAVAAILGHNYTFWLGFKGGKGIATTAGAIAPIILIPLVVAVISWIILLKTTRYVSIGSIAAALCLPTVNAIENLCRGTWDWPIFGFAFFAGSLAIWKHRGNIRRLLRGEEPRFQKKAKAPVTAVTSTDHSSPT